MGTHSTRDVKTVAFFRTTPFSMPKETECCWATGGAPAHNRAHVNSEQTKVAGHLYTGTMVHTLVPSYRTTA